MNQKKDMNQQALLDLNKTTLYERLKNVQRIKNLYVANDIIDILSNQKERDKRIISDYTEDEVVTHMVKRSSGLKLVRMFTLKGITRYLNEGKIYDLPNACSYFNVSYTDPKIKEYHLFIESIQDPSEKDQSIKKYKTTSLLKWLFGKRKMCKALSDYCSIEDVKAIFEDSEDIDKEKLAFLKRSLK